MYKIYLDPKINSKFRNIINEYIDFSIIKKYSNNDKAWNSICAIMDRIDDIVIYLNEKELNNGKWNRCAFDFFEFISQAAVLVECIDELFKIYEIRLPKHRMIFKSKIINKEYLLEAQKSNRRIKNDDSDYFNYIRSLSSVHPSKTDRHKIYQEADFEVSPYVVWKSRIYNLDHRCKGELVLVTYNNNSDELLTNKSIFIKEIFNFIKYKYYSLNYLIKKVKEYYNNQISELRKDKIKKIGEYGNYCDYLNSLILECRKRCPNMEDDIQEIIDILDINITDEENKIKYNKYCMALKYSIKAVHRQLQNMDFNCESPMDNLIGKLLIGEIYLEDTYDMNYNYPLSKILELNEQSGDRVFAKMMYKQLIPFFKKYIVINEEKLLYLSDKELYVLSQIAIYFHELENDGLINKYIPNTGEYR